MASREDSWDRIRYIGAATPPEPLPVTGSGGSITAYTSLVPFAYDYISITKNMDGTTNQVIYKTGGSGGTTVATLTLGYTGGVLSSITRS